MKRPQRLKKRLYFVVVSLLTAIGTMVWAPTAHASDTVTYEVVSDFITAANVTYFERSERKSLPAVPLPWRMTVEVPDALSPTKDGAEIRADWRFLGRWRYQFVTVRIYHNDKLLCSNILDVGNATCYGSTGLQPCASGGPSVTTPDCSYIPWPR